VQGSLIFTALAIDINAADLALGTQAVDVGIIDNNAAAFRIEQGVNLPFIIDTLDPTGAADTHDRCEVNVGLTTRVSANDDYCVRMDGAHAAGNARYTLVERFGLLPQVGAYAVGDNPGFELAGTNAADGNATFYAGGGVRLIDVGGANDQCIVSASGAGSGIASAWDDTVFSTSDEVTIRMGVRLVDVANIRVEAGIGNAPVRAVAADGDQTDTLYFRFDTSIGPNWFVNFEDNNDAAASVNTGVVAAAGVYRLAILVDAALVARFYINGGLVHVTAARTVGRDLGLPYYLLEDLGGAARELVVQAYSISKEFTT